MDQYVYKHLFHSKYSETHGVGEGDDDDNDNEFSSSHHRARHQEEKTLDETTDEVHQEVKLLKEKIGPTTTSVKPTKTMSKKSQKNYPYNLRCEEAIEYQSLVKIRYIVTYMSGRRIQRNTPAKMPPSLP